MGMVQAFWDSSVGKKAVMGFTGLVLVGFVFFHMLGNLQMFQGPEKMNGYAHFLRSTGGLLWLARAGLLVAVVLHIVAAVQLTRRKQLARPEAYVQRVAQVSTLASRTIRWGGALLLAFIVFHLLHFSVFVVEPSYSHTDVYSNVIRGFSNPVISLFYVVAMVFLGLHLYHGVWSSVRSLGVSPPSPRPLHRRAALALALVVWLGFTVIPLAVLAGLIR
jgi:succinate dehydrogenase / fumarate reductase, cytochrome b subunit